MTDKPTRKTKAARHRETTEAQTLQARIDELCAENLRLTERVTPTAIFDAARLLREALSQLYNAQNKPHTIEPTDECIRCKADLVTKKAIDETAWIEQMSMQVDTPMHRATDAHAR